MYAVILPERTPLETIAFYPCYGIRQYLHFIKQNALTRSKDSVLENAKNLDQGN